MKSVMLSIKPKYCRLIARGEKTIEIRKTKPKIETPFKCYMYCTKEKYNGRFLHTSDKNGCLLFWLDKNDCTIIRQPEDISYTAYTCNGKVIGEFVCDCIIPISITYSDPNNRIAQKEFPYTCLTDKEIMDYLGNGNQGYGWHISNLAIYEEPKELSEFGKECNLDCPSVHCPYWEYQRVNADEWDYDCSCNNIKPLTRPPQSWCYVEDLLDDRD